MGDVRGGKIDCVIADVILGSLSAVLIIGCKWEEAISVIYTHRFIHTSPYRGIEENEQDGTEFFTVVLQRDNQDCFVSHMTA